MRVRSFAQHEAAVAIAAFDESLVAHLQIDLGMAQRAAAAVTGDACAVHFNDLGGLGRHGYSSARWPDYSRVEPLAKRFFAG